MSLEKQFINSFLSCELLMTLLVVGASYRFNVPRFFGAKLKAIALRERAKSAHRLIR